MVYLFDQEHLSFYLLTVKLKETIDARIQHTRILTPTPMGTRSIEYPKEHIQKQPQQLQYRPLDPLRVVIKGGDQATDNLEVSGAKSPQSEWIITIEDKLEQARQEDMAGAWAKLCIYKVPQCLRECDDRAYIPQTVSLGPYHHGRRRLRSMERHKWRALYHLRKRTCHDIRMYLDSIKEVEEKARACYEGKITLGSNEFVEMMVLDGCFVLELFRGVTEGFTQLGYSRNDPIFAIRGSMHSIQRDMIMLENQLPLFVLDRILGIQYGQPEQTGMVAKLAVRFFDPLMPTDDPFSRSDTNKSEWSLGQATTFDPFSDQGGLHCLDVFRRSLLRTGPKPEPRSWIKRWSQARRVADKRRQQLIHCVTELSNSGIKFKKRKTDRFWDIKFKNGILHIPRLLIHDGTRSLFLNLISFEQCRLDSTKDITSYVIFMDNLINSPADVAYLHKHGIIEHWLGSEAEVADLFNKLCEEVVFDLNDSYLSGLSDQVNRYCNHRWNSWWASLKHTYFDNPWAIISLAAAVVLLLLTATQTFYGVYGYYKPR